MTYEHVVLNDDAFTNKAVAGYLASISDAGILLDLDECADLGLISDFAAVEIYELREPHILAQLHVACD